MDASQNSCYIELAKFYTHCSQATTCEDCVSSKNCGYDYVLGRCLPGNVQGPTCPMFPIKWTYAGGCINGPTSGSLTNVAPENRALIYPEIRSKLGLTNHYWKEIDPAGEVRVVSGDFSNLAADATKLINPEIRSAVGSTETPTGWKPEIPESTIVASGKVYNLAPDSVNLVSPKLPNV